MEVVDAWARQVPFRDICRLTLVPEGSIVRYIVRLDEACKDIRNAARTIGDPILHQLAEQTSALIRRDIVFAASLYYADDAKGPNGGAGAAGDGNGAPVPDGENGVPQDQDDGNEEEDGESGDEEEGEGERNDADDAEFAVVDNEDSEDEMSIS